MKIWVTLDVSAGDLRTVKTVEVDFGEDVRFKATPTDSSKPDLKLLHDHVKTLISALRAEQIQEKRGEES